MKGEFLDSENNEVEKNGEGSRLSVSQFESLIPVFDECKKFDSELEVLQYLKKKEVEELDIEEVRDNARASIRGTQIHQLQYFYQLFSRVEKLGRKITLEDFNRTFPNKDNLFKDNLYYNALYTIYNLVDNTEDPLEFWEAWRLNGHDFTLPEGITALIPPEEIKEMWERSAVTKDDIDKFSQNVWKIDREKLDPDKALLVNEAMFVTNTYLKNGNLQVPTMVDELVVPKEFPNKPIQLIDYKTGKQFKEPSDIDKLQIFLMMTSVLTNIYFKVEDIQWNQSMWEIAHDSLRLPFIPPRKYFNAIAIGKITEEDIFMESDFFRKLIFFKYVNPLTQESIEVNAKDLGIHRDEGIGDFLASLDDLNKFYTKYKKILKHKVGRSTLVQYWIPELGYDGFKKGNILKEQMQAGLGF
ncbi:MAG: hypothetical protein ACOX06_02970 [Candidatus Dojkabacteria bacterium]|jgi:hypothetical protein